ncbi:MAG: 3-isopropylmalate dehydratase [Candidatus Fermentibacteria bacterium]|nr:3-isopropylmalate dehydratase [Candidatus Fermentibacteria bacterium]
MASLQLKGRLWVLQRDGELVSDIDTDMIFHNQYLAITDIAKMGQYSFDNLEGFKDFAELAKPGDIILAGDNFGSGSSRQQAVDCFRCLGIQAIVARSYGAIYKRNAINSAFPVITLANAKASDFTHLEVVVLDMEKGILGEKKTEPMSGVQKDIFFAGGLFEYAETLK